MSDLPVSVAHFVRYIWAQYPLDMKQLFLIFLLGAYCSMSAQTVWTEPAFPAQDENFTLFYDASQGNGEVNGVVPLYGHLGLITNNSVDDSDWQHVIGTWGTADATVQMDYLGSGLYSFDYGGQTLEEFHGLTDGITVESLACVFRNTSGSLVGREADGGDIYYEMPEGSFALQVLAPQLSNCTLLNVGDEQTFDILISQSADISLSINSVLEAEENGTTLNYTHTFATSGEFLVELEATDGETTITDSFTLIVLPETAVEAPPAGVVDGINYIDDTTVILQLHAPFKDFVFAVGDFSSWGLDLDYFMKQAPGGQKWWVEISGLVPNQEYRYQYLIDQECLRVADMYADKILDKWNDPWIEEVTYPDLLAYPDDAEGSEPVAVFQTAQTDFAWTDAAYEPPTQDNLVIYELLLRDFTDAHSYQSLADTMSYFTTLGVTAIELMPIQEFNGNNSWGYNPTFYFAPDKYYGTKEGLKNFINAAHNAGIAVIMDVAFNHSDLPNPQLKMYWDEDFGEWGAPSTENPWFNQTAPHDQQWFFDYDHSAVATKDFVKRFMEYWVEDYHIDGWRWDFTQGMTQTNTIGGWGGAYDQFRIDLLNEYGNHIWGINPDTYMILEHWSDQGEEQALSANGFMLWANVVSDYQEATMGYPGNFDWANYQSHGYSDPHAVGYLESHDEERLMYKNLNFGNSNGSYVISNLQTALKRVELAACFNAPMPGPRMIWQFGELGYDYSINTCSDGVTVAEACRVDPKPIRWDYREDYDRYHVYQVMAALNHLKADYPVFQTTDFSIDVSGTGKRMFLHHPDMEVVIVGNFDVTGFDMTPGFSETGTWYDYFTGDVLEVTDLGASYFYEAGAYHLYTNEPLPLPDFASSLPELERELAFGVYPNPSAGAFNLTVDLPVGERVSLEVLDMQGRSVGTLALGTLGHGNNHIQWNGVLDNGAHLPSGAYLFNLTAGTLLLQQAVVVQAH